MRRAATLVVGIGNEDRGDDAVGAQVVRTLLARWGGVVRAGVDVRALRGDALALLDALQGYDRVVLVDATAPNGAPGTVRCFRSARALRGTTSPSTHGWSVAEALALGEALGSLPKRVVIVGVEAENFDHGTMSSAAVRAGVEDAANTVETVLAEPA
ncbi:MAG: hydrogenase maturation protease [Trueperaceae bacterium]